MSAIFDPNYSDYFAQLGMIQLETHRGTEGLEGYVHASFVSSRRSAEYADMDSLFHSRVKDSTSLVRVRDSLFEESPASIFTLPTIVPGQRDLSRRVFPEIVFLRCELFSLLVKRTAKRR